MLQDKDCIFIITLVSGTELISNIWILTLHTQLQGILYSSSSQTVLRKRRIDQCYMIESPHPKAHIYSDKIWEAAKLMKWSEDVVFNSINRTSLY